MGTLRTFADATAEELSKQTKSMTGGTVSLESSISNILNAVYLILGIVGVVMIIIGGVNYTLSQGDPGKVQKAKNTVLYGIIGLVVALLAFAITQFVINAIQGAN